MHYNFGYAITPETTSSGHGTPEYSISGRNRIDPRNLLLGFEPGIFPNDLFLIRDPRKTINFPNSYSTDIARIALANLAQNPNGELNYLSPLIYREVAPPSLDKILAPAEISRLVKAERNSPLLFKRFDSEQLEIDGKFVNPLRNQNQINCIPVEDIEVNDVRLKEGIKFYDSIHKPLKLFQRHPSKIRPIGPRAVNTGTSLRDITVPQTFSFLNRIFPSSEENVIVNSVMGTLASQVTSRTKRVIDLPQMNYELDSENTYSGKGSGKEAVFASVLSELLERYQILPGMFLNWPQGYDFDIKRCQINNLTGKVLNPNEIGSNVVYHDNEPIYWMRAESMKTGEPIWAPLQAFFLDSNLGEPEILVSSSNGAASGTTLEDAKLQATLELVERDAINSGWFSENNIFKVLPQESNPELSRVLINCEQSGLDINFIDYTNDIGIPVYRCVMRLENDQIVSGEGAHLNGEIAITRALYEMLGHLPKLQQTMGQNIGTRQLLDYQGRKRPLPEIQYRNIGDNTSIPNFSSNTVRGDLEYLVDLFCMNGANPIWADMTHKDIGYPTVRVIVPGITTPIWLNRREISSLQYKLKNHSTSEQPFGKSKRHRH